jgi:hypothetical protein
MDLSKLPKDSLEMGNWSHLTRLTFGVGFNEIKTDTP